MEEGWYVSGNTAVRIKIRLKKKYDTKQQKTDKGDQPPTCETNEKSLQEQEVLRQVPMNKANSLR